MNSTTRAKALEFLVSLTQVMSPFNPTAWGSVLMSFKTRAVRIVFDRLYYDYGFEYFVKLLSEGAPFSSWEWEQIGQIKNLYLKKLGASQLQRLISIIRSPPASNPPSCAKVLR
jgi:hypothetical protein